MTEKIKTMGKIEYGLGVVYGIIIAAYSAGLPVSNQVILVAGIFTIAYFGHWVMLLVDKMVDNKILLERLDSERTTAREARTGETKPPSTSPGESPGPVY